MCVCVGGGGGGGLLMSRVTPVAPCLHGKPEVLFARPEQSYFLFLFFFYCDMFWENNRYNNLINQTERTKENWFSSKCDVGRSVNKK